MFYWLLHFRYRRDCAHGNRGEDREVVLSAWPASVGEFVQWQSEEKWLECRDMMLGKRDSMMEGEVRAWRCDGVVFHYDGGTENVGEKGHVKDKVFWEEIWEAETKTNGRGGGGMVVNFGYVVSYENRNV